MPSELKKLMVEEIDLRIGSVSALVLVGLTGLTANENNEVRSQAAENEIGIFVVKSSLAKLVFSKHDREDLTQYLEGPTAAIYGEDPIEVAKFAKELAGRKDMKEKVELRGGWLIGQHCDLAEVTRLADMPPYEEMVAKVLATIASPVNDLLSSVSSPMSNLLNVLEQVRESKDENKEAS